MILILSNKSDKESKEVSKWLTYLGKQFILESNLYNLYSKRYKTNFESVWFRKLEIPNFSIHNNKNDINEISLKKFLLNEVSLSLSYINSEYRSLKNIGNILSMDLNKYNILLAAIALGIKVPKTIITTNKEELKEFINENETIITKPISNITAFPNKAGKELIIPYTTKITKNQAEQISDFFYPSLVQKYINISHEIKSVYFDGKIHSMSIYSDQFNNEVDLKKVIKSDKFAKLSPYNLPLEIQRKINQLFKKLELNIGTFDIIEDFEGNHFFLEINPSGQFNTIVEVTNCDIYKRIAEYL